MRWHTLNMAKDLQKSGDPSTMTFGSEKGKWMRVIVYKAGRKACRDDNIIGNQSENRRHRPSSDPFTSLLGFLMRCIQL